jgi:hypothetical protein
VLQQAGEEVVDPLTLPSTALWLGWARLAPVLGQESRTEKIRGNGGYTMAVSSRMGKTVHQLQAAGEKVVVKEETKVDRAHSQERTHQGQVQQQGAAGHPLPGYSQQALMESLMMATRARSSNTSSRANQALLLGITSPQLCSTRAPLASRYETCILHAHTSQLSLFMFPTTTWVPHLCGSLNNHRCCSMPQDCSNPVP